MRQISFKVVTTDVWFGEAIDFEMPMAAAEGSPGIAGSYMGIAAASHLPPSRHFLGIHDSPRRENAKTDILWCRDCGEPGCWPLLTKITIDDDCIVWSQFEQPHRAGNGKRPRWWYDDFGPFTFNRTQYELSLNNASDTHREQVADEREPK